MKSAGWFVLKSVAFSVLFWAVGGVLFWTANNFNRRQPAQPAGEGDNSALMQKYWDQAAEADAIQEIYRKQLSESEDLMQKQRELLGRWERVVENWERHEFK